VNNRTKSSQQDLPSKRQAGASGVVEQGHGSRRGDGLERERQRKRERATNGVERESVRWSGSAGTGNGRAGAGLGGTCQLLTTTSPHIDSGRHRECVSSYLPNGGTRAGWLSAHVCAICCSRCQLICRMLLCWCHLFFHVERTLSFRGDSLGMERGDNSGKELCRRKYPPPWDDARWPERSAIGVDRKKRDLLKLRLKG